MGTHPIFESDFDCLTESFKMKKLADLTLEEVQQELEKRGLSVAGEDQELGQLLTELSRQRLSDWLEDNDHDPDDFVFEEITEEPETENQVDEEKEEIEDKEEKEAKESSDEEETPEEAEDAEEENVEHEDRDVQ